MRLFPCNSHTLSEITGFHSMWFLQDTSSPYQDKRNYHRAYKNLPALQMIKKLQFANCPSPIMHLVCKFSVTFVFSFPLGIIIVPRETEDNGCAKVWGRGRQTRCIMGDVQMANLDPKPYLVHLFEVLENGLTPFIIKIC